MLKMRIAIEEFMARKTVHHLIERGYFITMNDGEVDTVKKSQNIRNIVSAMFSTDGDVLKVYTRCSKQTDDGEKFEFKYIGRIDFIYGNDGYDVISDYSISLEEDLKPLMELAEVIDGGKFSIEIMPNEEAWNK